MSSTLGLAIGASFVELSGHLTTPTTDGHSTTSKVPYYQTRWYLPKKSLGDALSAALPEAFAASEKACGELPSRLCVATDSVERILNREQGRAPAVLITTGFESWLPLRQPLISPPFSMSLERRQLPLDTDSIFGVSERMRHDGSVHTKLDLDELTFLAAKLDLLKVKEVAILYLHATTNPAHELATASFLRERGFRVFMSHTASGQTLEERWQATIENAFSDSALQDEKAQIETAMSAFPGCELEIWTSSGRKPWAEHSTASVRGGLNHAVHAYAASLAGQGSSFRHLHCGLDEIRMLGEGKTRKQPTTLVANDAWPFPHLTGDCCGFEPGPMMFGRSHQLTALDVLFVRDRLLPIEGFSSLASDKSRSRILESLFTLAKSPSASAKNRPPDAAEISIDIEQAFIEEIIVLVTGKTGADGQTPAAKKSRLADVVLSGALSSSLQSLLSQRRFDLRFRLTDAAEFFESRACAVTA